MYRLTLALAALTVAACSRGDRSVPPTDNSARELRVARPDSTDTVGVGGLASRGNQPVSPVEQQTPQPQPPSEARPSPKPRPRKHAAAPPPPPQPARVPADTAEAQGYAPTSDTAVARDSSPPQPSDTMPAGTPDTATARAPMPDTVAAATVAPTPDTASAVAVAPTVTSDAVAKTLPIGTEIHAALDDSINSRSDSAGRPITAQITDNVRAADGTPLIPSGTTVHLTVVRLSPAKSKSSQGQLVLRVDGIQIGGELRKVEANVHPVPSEFRGRGVTTGDAAKVGVGAAGGAVLGRVLGGNTKGAVIGGVVGAAGGAVVASQTATRDVVVKAKTPLVFVLTAPLVTQ